MKLAALLMISVLAFAAEPVATPPKPTTPKIPDPQRVELALRYATIKDLEAKVATGASAQKELERMRPMFDSDMRSLEAQFPGYQVSQQLTLVPIEGYVAKPEPTKKEK